MILIGSNALSIKIDIKRPCRDVDVICSYEEFDVWVKQQSDIKGCYPIDSGKKMIVVTKSQIYEFEIAWENSTAKSFIELIKNDKQTRYIYIDELTQTVTIPSLNALYSLKMSHRFLRNSPHFKKTMNDILLMRKNGAVIPEAYKNWFKEREKATYTYAHPKLNQNKSDFFDPNQGVTYQYDHDSVHLAMAQLNSPAYTFFKDDQKEVMCSKKKFFDSPVGIRLYSVLEESYVLALERSQIPFKGQISPEKSFNIALEKVCTSISSGWWREFAWDNYFRVKSLYNENYVEKFWKAVESGIVKKL